MKHQVLFSLTNKEEVFMMLSAVVLIGALRVRIITSQYLNHIRQYTLKVGSCCFDCIIILLIYFLNCRKAFFTRK